ncbi:MAG TPA: TetR/AcrR family transcriptional regulator [Candidatus Saccharimonadia bacterium]
MSPVTANPTRKLLLEAAAAMLGREGYDGTTMRKLAEVTGVKQPVIYYYFASKEALLQEAFILTSQRLRAALASWPASPDARELLRQRLLFTWRQAELTMTMLNYFLGQKRVALDDSSEPMRIPPAASRHLREAIELGIEQGVYESADPGRDASIMLHALNGFAMEHFPQTADAANPELPAEVLDFFERALRPALTSRKES